MLTTSTLPVWFPLEKLQEIAYVGLVIYVRKEEVDKLAYVTASRGSSVYLAFEKEVECKEGTIVWREERVCVQDKWRWLFRIASKEEAKGRRFSVFPKPTGCFEKAFLRWQTPLQSLR